MNVLISGAGIAGPTLAYWLVQHGIDATLVEKAPAARTGGYIIDFWGAGYDIAERMQLAPELAARGYHVKELRMVGRDGRRRGGFATGVIERLTGGRFTSLPRGDLAAMIHGTLAGRVETLFGDSIAGLEDDGRVVRVQFERAAPRTFDLVVGADGLHSTVRERVFGPQAQFERYLGYRVAAFSAPGYLPRDEPVYVVQGAPGTQVGRFAMRGDRTMFLFVFRDDDSGPAMHDTAAQKALLHARYDDGGWECEQILAALDDCDDLYFDRVSQIVMPAWTRGRVALVGDAAACVSLIAGQGSALAMVEAYVLAGELAAAAGDHARAFAAYEARLRPFLANKQRAARKFARSFVPSSRFQLFVRDQAMKLLGVPGVARLAFGGTMLDKIELPRLLRSRRRRASRCRGVAERHDKECENRRSKIDQLVLDGSQSPPAVVGVLVPVDRAGGSERIDK